MDGAGDDLPEGFDDEEIDEDMAFTEEDRVRSNFRRSPQIAIFFFSLT